MLNREHRVFLKKLKPYPFCTESDEEEKQVYFKIINIPYFRQDNTEVVKNSEDDMIHITLINNYMLNYDAYFFEQENQTKIYYRPYFYEFYANPNNINRYILSFLMENEGIWMTGEIHENEDNEDNGLNYKKEHIILGDIFFSASPFKTKGVSLIITDNTVPIRVKEKCLKTYNTSSSIVLPNSYKYNKMKKIIEKNTEEKRSKAGEKCKQNFITKIYNVGQGNCVYIQNKAKHRILFDIGYTKTPGSFDWQNKYIIKSRNSIRHMKPHLNILSHWDMDHIIGIAFAQKNMFDHTWIAPDIGELPKAKVSIGAARLAKYLSWKNNLYLIGSNFLGKSVYSGSGFNLWRGIGKDNHPNGLNKANNFGLIIELVIDEHRMLLPGDCEYTMFPQKLNFSNTRYNYLMVPHHCSKMKYLPLCKLPDSDNNYAIISAGDNSYSPRHPYCNHINYLISGKYNIGKTDGNFYIEINLNKCSYNIV
ncbi:hypothetical protein ACMXKO_10220 [Clostridium tyrobutyricum]|uniref:hypothetical protein n=1 Tax=Clostridium tyrobutyricum TaxID=1519 RepID=UPI0039F69620